MENTDKQKIKISGYASVFNYIDKQNDIILPGAFKNNINQFQYIPLLFQHNPSQILGRIYYIAEDNTGLFIKAEITPTSLGVETSLLIQNKALNHFSIGFNIISSDIHCINKLRNQIIIKNPNSCQTDQIRVIKNINLIEISAVTFPANVKAQIKHQGDNYAK